MKHYDKLIFELSRPGRKGYERARPSGEKSRVPLGMLGFCAIDSGFMFKNAKVAKNRRIRKTTGMFGFFFWVLQAVSKSLSRPIQDSLIQFGRLK